MTLGISSNGACRVLQAIGPWGSPAQDLGDHRGWDLGDGLRWDLSGWQRRNRLGCPTGGHLGWALGVHLGRGAWGSPRVGHGGLGRMGRGGSLGVGLRGLSWLQTVAADPQLHHRQITIPPPAPAFPSSLPNDPPRKGSRATQSRGPSPRPPSLPFPCSPFRFSQTHVFSKKKKPLLKLRNPPPHPQHHPPWGIWRRFSPGAAESATNCPRPFSFQQTQRILVTFQQLGFKNTVMGQQHEPLPRTDPGALPSPPKGC